MTQPEPVVAQDAGATEHLPVGQLPPAVRARLLARAADALAGLEAEQVPAALRAFRTFTPTRRARHAGPTLAAALERDPVFRQLLAGPVRAAAPELSARIEAGRADGDADPLDVAALAWLLRPEGWTATVAAASEQARAAADDAATAATAGAVARLEHQLATARTAARQDLDRLRAELRAAKEEAAGLRHKLRAARDAARDARAAATAAEGALAEARSAGAAAGSAADAEVRRLRSRLAEVEAGLETARRAAREGRAFEDARLRLLLDTVVEAAQGLRRELALPPSELRPADVLAAVRPEQPGVGDVAGRALAAEDPALLDQLLALPQVHVVVDGYNVTKTGYGGLPLEDQRHRLVTGLAALAARSGAEVTVCFDGAALDAPVPGGGARGVRVLFSRPGETADELIRRLVRNEPQGRALVVVSSDREVADGVRAAGARPLPSAALLRRLERG